MISRRAFLSSTAAAVVAPLLPTVAAPELVVGVDLASGPDLVAYYVGTPGEFDGEAIFAASPQEAFKEWVFSKWGDEEDHPFNEEFVNREPRWDRLKKVTPADWIRVGLGHVCDRCGYETCADQGARAVGTEAVCEECLTIADRVAIEPDDLVDDLANRIADESREEVEEWLIRGGGWAAVQGDIWDRACAAAEETV